MGDPQHTDGAQNGDGGSSVGEMVLGPKDLEAAAELKPFRFSQKENQSVPKLRSRSLFSEGKPVFVVVVVVFPPDKVLTLLQFFF